MRYCVFGLGAIGGQIAANMERAGLDVTGVARSKTCATIRDHGLIVEHPDGRSVISHPRVTSSAAKLGHVDVVILAVKSTVLGAITDDLERLISPNTIVVTAMNGLPWWFVEGLDLNELPEESDLDDRLRRLAPARNIVGCAVHLSATVQSPGHVVRTAGNRLALGPADHGGPAATQLRDIAADLRLSGYDVDQAPDVRRAIWHKLLGNLTLNPVSMITRSTVDRIIDDDLAIGFVEACMAEAQTVGAALGFTTDTTPHERLELTRAHGRFTTSMHQDAEAGRAVELDGLVGSVHRLGAALGIATPNLGTLLGLARLHAQAHDLLPAR